MKLNIRKMLSALAAVISFLGASCQPPAQGPEPVSDTTNLKELPLFIIGNMIKIKMRDSIIPTIDSSISAQDPPIKITVTAEITPRKPSMMQTQFTDRPNENYVSVPFKVDYTLHLNNLPNRHLFQNLSINITAKDWYVDAGGTLTFTLNAEKPYLDGPSFTEQAINFFIGNWLTPFIDSKIRSSLPNAIRQVLPVEIFDPKCNRLDVVVPPNDPTYKNSYIEYQYKRPPLSQSVSSLDKIKVSLKSIRRLKAHNYEMNSILYDSSENINIELFANQKLIAFPMDQFKEEEVRSFPANEVTLVKPASTGSLILLANIMQSNFMKDSRFIEFKSNKSFGNGTQKLIVKKSFISKPRPLPGGGMSKPQTIWQDAYELTIQVNVNTPAVSVSQ